MALSFRMVRNLGLLIMVAVIAIIGVFSFTSSSRIIRSVSLILKEKQPILEKMDSIRQDFLDARDTLVAFSKQGRGDIKTAITSIDNAIEKSTALNKLVLEKDKQEVAKFIFAAKRFKIAVNTYAKEVKNDPTGSSSLSMEQLALDTIREVSNALSKMISDIRANIRASDINTFIVAKRSQRLISLCVFIGIAVSLLIAIFMGRALTRPISRLAEATQRIAQGNLAYRINIGGRDEIGRLAEAFNKMAEELGVSMENEKRKSAELINEIASRKEFEQELELAFIQLKDTQDKLVQSAKMASVGQLAGGVAHEINNPLTGVLNNAQLIKMIADKNSGQIEYRQFKELLDVIEESALRCKKITQSLLDFSHASKGVSVPVSLNDIAEKVVLLIEHEMKLENITIQKQFQPDLPSVLGDSQLLQQVIMDILVNARWAIKKFPGRGGIITIQTRYDLEREQVHIDITDTGIGIPKENIDKIFEPFFTTKTVGEGTGLGLSVVYNIINAHNGSIAAESEVGKGTTFRIGLPVA